MDTIHTDSRMRILVIEDDRLVADLMRQVLEDDGYAVDIAAIGGEGQRLAMATAYDAIVLDLELPDRSGLSVLQELRREGSVTPIVVATRVFRIDLFSSRA